ncbi:MAG: GTP cyclohydrolase MptA [Synergistaceae bacterium]
MENPKNNLGNDIQSTTPKTTVALTKVGITGVERVLKLKSSQDGKGTQFFATMDLFVHLDATKAGVHMSRFIQNMEDISVQMSAESSPTIENLAQEMALAIAQTQGAARAEVRIKAQFPTKRHAPVSNIAVESLYKFIGHAVSDGHTTKRAIGIEAKGLTACPCSREMTGEYSKELLKAKGYTEAQAKEITDLLPLAAHNQRGIGTLIVGTEQHISAETLVRIVEKSMSSEIYPLLKRPDELHIVTKAHTNPMFVEDVVRKIIQNVMIDLPNLDDDTFIKATQENLESIHSHSAYAERCGILGKMRAETKGENVTQYPEILSLSSWLDSQLK